MDVEIYHRLYYVTSKSSWEERFLSSSEKSTYIRRNALKIATNDAVSVHAGTRACARRTADDFSRVGVSGTLGIHRKSVTRIYICRRKAIAGVCQQPSIMNHDRETIVLRNACDRPTCVHGRARGFRFPFAKVVAL